MLPSRLSGAVVAGKRPGLKEGIGGRRSLREERGIGGEGSSGWLGA